MIGPARARRRRLPLTPLIDVIFLLLLFFMLSSTFLRFSSVEVTASGPSGPSAAPTSGRLALLKLRNDGSLALNGGSVERGDLAGALNRLADDGTERVVVTAERGGTVADLVGLLEVLEDGRLPVVLAGGAAGATP